jgi:hypothetical protein
MTSGPRKPDGRHLQADRRAVHPRRTRANVTFTERDHNHFHSETSGLSFRGAFFIHVVVLPSGEVKVTREVDSEDGVCLG